MGREWSGLVVAGRVTEEECVNMIMTCWELADVPVNGCVAH